MEYQVLIVEDEEIVRDMEFATLQGEGYLCHTAANADAASELVQQRNIDLALIDINMPGRSGVQFLKELKEASPDSAAIMVTAVDDLETAMYCLQLGADDYILKPFNLDRILLSVRNALEKRRLVLENRVYQRQLEAKVREQTQRIRTTLDELQDAYDSTLAALVRSLDAREKETGSHSERVRSYTLALAEVLGVEQGRRDDLAMGALLHDIGKVGVSDNILLKPGKLDEQEWEVMRRHSRIGYDIICGVRFLDKAAEVVLSHHERYDGGGYPDGLKGEEIPLGARIFAIADTLDAMTSDRPYRKALPFQAVVDELKRCSGTQFDPRMVEAFLSIPKRQWEEIAGKALD
ncbi:two-component system response regulator [Desulfuromonas versatilis]|uniref:Two-component system response regulator n=1 Tax=Desulfuromonas versatilis TaxID=2802975 RepID=A0ABN6DY25_9BACT|nr:HD domain-containing phosphohydrolase [Desulfuromonas versatilis]BCR04419.1 two-component system response regulator [Desulfuromonas versatilis]